MAANPHAHETQTQLDQKGVKPKAMLDQPGLEGMGPWGNGVREREGCECVCGMGVCVWGG